MVSWLDGQFVTHFGYWLFVGQIPPYFFNKLCACVPLLRPFGYKHYWNIRRLVQLKLTRHIINLCNNMCASSCFVKSNYNRLHNHNEICSTDCEIIAHYCHLIK